MDGLRPIEMAPNDVWAQMESDPETALVDVRSHAEWTFVGLPDTRPAGRRTLAIEWRSFPGMALNEQFVGQLMEQLGGDVPKTLFFICRSGARSMEAAMTVAGALSQQGIEATCVNVAEGFEGDLDGHGHRGVTNGWKVHGLPWRQG
ncbi:MAG: rhodanese-like domain-containing protein [Pseudomonadota bacterium]